MRILELTDLLINAVSPLIDVRRNEMINKALLTIRNYHNFWRWQNTTSTRYRIRIVNIELTRYKPEFLICLLCKFYRANSKCRKKNIKILT